MLSRRDGYPESTPAPPLEIPEAGEHLWDWYSEMSQRYGRIADGICSPIPPSEWVAWQKLNGYIIYPWEHRIMGAMDVAFCAEMNKELEDKRATYQRKAEQKPRKGRK